MRSPGCQRDEQDIGRQCGEWGFTLPELLATIAIIIITAAIAIPSFFGLIEARRVESAANQLAADLRLSQSRATSQVGTTWVVSLVLGRGLESAGADYYLINTTAATIVPEPRTLPGNTMIGTANLVADPTALLSGLGLPSTRSSLYFCSVGNARWTAGSEVLTANPCYAATTLASKEIIVSAGGSSSRAVRVVSGTSGVEVVS